MLLDLDSAGYFGLNSAGAQIWELLEMPRTLPELIEQLRSGYDDPPATIDRDVSAFVTALHVRTLVEVGNADGG